MVFKSSINTGGATIPGTIIGGTDGSVLFVHPANTLAQNNANFNYDTTNARLYVGTASDFTGAAGINTTRFRGYMPQSAVGTFPNPIPGATADNFPGCSAYSSAGTAASPTQLANNAWIGQHSFWGYMGSGSPAYVPMAGLYARVAGVTANDKGADLYLYQKFDNNIGYYNTWKFRNDGALVSGGYYNHIGIMASQNDGAFLSGALDRNDSGYFGGVLNLSGGGLGNAADYGNGVPLQYNGSGTSIEGAQRVFFNTNITGWDLQLGNPASSYYNGLQIYSAYSGTPFQIVDYNSGLPNFNINYFGEIKSNDPYNTKLGNVFAPNPVNSLTGYGTVNIYQATSGDNFQMWIDKNDNVIGTLSDTDFLFLGATASVKNINTTGTSQLFTTYFTGSAVMQSSLNFDSGININVGSVGPYFVQPSLGNLVMGLSSIASNDDPSESVYQNKVTTTNSTVTTIATIAIPSSTTVGIEARITARRTGGASGTAEDGAHYIIKSCYKNVAGTATQIGSSLVEVWESQAAWDVTFTQSSGNALLQVTGAASNNISWGVTYRTYPMGT